MYNKRKRMLSATLAALMVAQTVPQSVAADVVEAGQEKENAITIEEHISNEALNLKEDTKTESDKENVVLEFDKTEENVENTEAAAPVETEDKDSDNSNITEVKGEETENTEAVKPDASIDIDPGFVGSEEPGLDNTETAEAVKPDTSMDVDLEFTEPEETQLPNEDQVEEEEKTVLEDEVQEKAATPELQNATVIIPADSTMEDVTEILNDALIANMDEVDTDGIEWEYKCEGKSKLNAKNIAWGSIGGFTSQTKTVGIKTTYTHPSLANNKDGNYQVRIAGTDKEVTLKKRAKLDSNVEVSNNCSVKIPYDAEGNIDFDALKQNLFEAIVESSEPELSYAQVQFTYKDSNDWVALEGKDGVIGGIGAHAPISAGNHRIKIEWAGNDTYYGFEDEVNVTLTEREQVPYTKKETIDPVILVVDDNMNTDYEAIENAVFHAVIEKSDVLTEENVEVKYYYKGLTSLDSKWLPLEGESVLGSVGYPAVSAGKHKVQISFPGNQDYAPATVEADVTFAERPSVSFHLNDKQGDTYEVGLAFSTIDSYDYDTTAKNVFEAVVGSTENPADLKAEDVKIEYNIAQNTVVPVFKALNESDPAGLLKFGPGKWQIRISWDGNKEFKGGSVVVDVNMVDGREESKVVLKDGVSFIYNMDVNVMKNAIYDSVIDWNSSALPAKDTLSLDDFVIEYEASLQDIETGVELPKIPGMPEADLGSKWVPIEGKKYQIGGTVLGQYPQIGAGEQKLRVKYVGNADYRPSAVVEGTVKVEKASVKVKVKNISQYADKPFSAEGFVTTNPADKFDIYTISAGVTSNVTTIVYLNLPDRYQNETFLNMLDPVVNKIFGKTFSQMMNEGMNLGELRKLLSTQELLDLLKKLNIDTGTFGQILTVINKLPAVTDNVTVAFGYPSRAGMYMVTAVTDNKNYNTGVGVGTILLKMRNSGSKLAWNESLPRKISAENAKNFDFNATLSCDGVAVEDQSSVRYLYTGVTSKWRSYTSTTTPPTEPGRYTVTVCIIGGNYMAAPLTRSFQITK